MNRLVTNLKEGNLHMTTYAYSQQNRSVVSYDHRSQNVLRTLRSFDRAPVPGRRKNKSLLNKNDYGVKATTDSFHVVPTIWLELYSERLKIEPHVHGLRLVCSHFALDVKASQAF